MVLAFKYCKENVPHCPIVSPTARRPCTPPGTWIATCAGLWTAPGQLLRMSKDCRFSGIPKECLKYCFYSRDRKYFEIPPANVKRKHRIVVMTVGVRHEAEGGLHPHLH
ncbi:hypothetical protein ACOMHN_028233 [Nucella lapillus]